MQTLKKHKKKGEEGFKNFIYFLEEAPQSTKNNIIFIALLEDPVYMQYILKNLQTFDRMTLLDSNEIITLIQSLPNPIQTFVYALSGEQIEERFITNSLPPTMKREYQDEKSFITDNTPAKKNAAQFSIIKTIHGLQKNLRITSRSFSIPPSDILYGRSGSTSDNGQYEQLFENGSIALLGNIKRTLREGSWQHYYPNGQLMAEGIYINDDKAGTWKFYYSNGNIKSSGEFVENLKQGEWKNYTISGQPSSVKFNRGKSA